MYCKTRPNKQPLRFGWLVVLSLYKKDHLQFLNVFPFVVSGKVEYPYTGLTTPVEWILLLQLAV